ncbi:MAG TPA: pyridoxal phosphate-dependent aminotransferase [Candidatus Baltobacteraceae bacterium]|nr:pyridoxal phosphate-dependent aminotransferase [Candidatus Baltobacteraceae bacterium]
MPTIAASALKVPGSRIRELANAALGMDGVLKLYFGESSLPTPEYMKRAVAKALAEGYTFYTENAGIPGLREDLAHMYQRLHGVMLDPRNEIVVTASGVQALNLGIRCVIDAGDEALVLAPAWPNASAIVRMFHGTPIDIPLRLDGERYRVDFVALEAAVTSRTRLLVYTSPSNPLGWVASESEQAALLDFARRHDLWLLADEVYERLYYAGAELGVPAPSMLKLASRSDGVLVAQSFSKTYCMTGWRLGWLVLRRDVAERAATLNEFIVSHATSFIQRAAQTALADGEDELRTMLVRLRDNRDFCLAALRRMPGVSVPAPEGAFYLFPRIAGLEDSFAFCWKLLHEMKVGLAPGVAFGAGGEGSVRICYAAERPILEEAMDRLGRFLANR